MPINPNAFTNLSEREMAILAATQVVIDEELRLSYVEGRTVSVRNELISLIFEQNPRVLTALKQSYAYYWEIVDYNNKRGEPWLSFSARPEMLDPPHFGNGACAGFRTITEDYLISTEDHHIWVDASNGPVVVTLPPALDAACYTFNVKKVDSSSNFVTIVANDLLDGFSSYMIDIQYESITMISNGATWGIV